MTTELAGKTCTPCKGGVAPLTPDQAREMQAKTPEWALMENATRIERKFTFGDFQKALEFVNKAGAVAEEENHHPDICFGWGYATVSLQTHKIKGLHENDFIMAAKIDALVS